LSEVYRKRKYKKYFFIEPKPHESPELENDISKQRIKEEIQEYERLKGSERIVEVEDGLTYFLINSNWVNKWRNFV